MLQLKLSHIVSYLFQFVSWCWQYGIWVFPICSIIIFKISLGTKSSAGWRWLWISKALRVCHREEGYLRVLPLGCCSYTNHEISVHLSWNIRSLNMKHRSTHMPFFQGLWIPALLRATTRTTSWDWRIPTQMPLDKTLSLGYIFLSWLQTAIRFLALGVVETTMVCAWLRQWKTLSMTLVWRLHVDPVHFDCLLLVFAHGP